MPTPDLDLTGAKILLVDDTPENLKILRETLEAEGYSILVATSGEAALKIATSGRPDLILLDVMMPGMDGFETCRRLKQDEITRDIPVLFVTARGETEAVLEGFTVGGVDYIVKPFQSQEVLMRVRTHLQIDRLARDLARSNAGLTRANEDLQEEIARRKALGLERDHLAEHLSLISSREAEQWGLAGFVGESRTLRETLESVGRLQGSQATVLIVGESGTGKELVARAIHHGSPRASGPSIPVNCPTSPSELAESMLFGHVRGAFTGADRDRPGSFVLADGGTLFLDEIGDMSSEIQAKLLRVLEDGLVFPVGASRETRVDVRVVAATNSDLQAAMSEGTFRQDLYYRLARFPIVVPPLRERREDIPLLARHFLRMFATEMGREAPELNPEALAILESYAFPGNVRELKNTVERALIESGGGEICPEHLHLVRILPEIATEGHPAADPRAAAAELPLDLRQAEDLLIERALEQTAGNIAAAARLLGTNRPRIYRFLRQREGSAKSGP